MSYATEEGYAYLYISNENATAVDVYFDDVTMTYTPTRVIQYNEYYPFGLQTSNSWTRENSSNNFLYNEGSELNSTTGFYDLPFRNYDATLGRFFQIDPLAHVDHSTSPFAYAGNNPVMMNDPSGLFAANPGITPTDRAIYRKYASSGSALDFGTWAQDFGYDGILASESIIIMNGGGGGGATFGQRFAEGLAKEILGIDAKAGVAYIRDPTGKEWVNAQEIVDYNNSYQNADYVSRAYGALAFVTNLSGKATQYAGWEIGEGTISDYQNFSFGAIGQGVSDMGSYWANGLSGVASIFGMGFDIGTHPNWLPTHLDFTDAAKKGKAIGQKLSILGALVSVGQLLNNPSGGNAVNAIFGVVGAIPGPGTIIGGVYFGIDLLTTGITGKGFSEHIDSYYWIMGPVGLGPIPLFKLPGK